MAAPKEAPLFKLPPEMTSRLTGLQSDIDKSRKAIAVMKELGMDTRELEDKLTWAETVRKTLLREFA